jgi:D-serine deaminase-like pyridoxal phosphate-dependent protein
VDILDLPTPSLLIDLDRLEANAQKMSRKMKSHSVRLRPHVKTHKCVQIAKLQCQGHFGGITVSTLAEARHFSAHGFTDITWAFPLPHSKLSDALDLSAEIPTLNLLIDDLQTVSILEATARQRGQKANVYLKVDCGYGRAGVTPGSPESVLLVKRLAASSSIHFRGLLTHAGHSYACSGKQEVQDVAREERDSIVQFAEEICRFGVEVEEISIGSTPTMRHCQNLQGVTETRPGNYALFDLFQAAIGSCENSDIAVSILSSVVSGSASRGHFIIDAGALALSKDRGATHVQPNNGYGMAVEAISQMPIHDSHLKDLSQEHGKLISHNEAQLNVGNKIRIVPNHSCLATACHESYYAVRGREVVDQWFPTRGW